jgi:hypothetical protein
MQYFTCSGGISSDSTKKRVGTSYAKLLFLYPVGSTGHVVHSDTSGVQNVNALFNKNRTCVFCI